MEEDDTEERLEVLGFIPQNENIYNKLLPYADKLDIESNRLFTEIKTNLVKSVLAREMRPGCVVWTSRLITYIKIYGLKFSKEDHIALVKLYYELVTIPNLESVRINKFAMTLNLLLKKKLLSPDDLQLNWWPLYQLHLLITEKRKVDIGMYKHFSTLDIVIESLIRICRYYFPVQVTQEMLDEFRPKLCPYSSTADISRALEYLELFLPIFVPYELRHIGYDLWLKELLNFWEVCHNANNWENHLTWLMARLSCNNTGHIDWEPYIPIMFVRFARALHLPVSYRKRQSGKQYKIDASAAAVWIVSGIGGKSNVMFFHLEKFMQMLETYYHPANMGKWSPRIRDLLKKLSYYFVQRVYFERNRKNDWQCRTPDDFKLTDSDIDRFINIVKPCLEQAMFSRQGSQDVAFAFQYLAALRPDIVVPIVLDKLYISMDSLTEPHRFTSALICMMSVARFMANGAKNNYIEGPTHLFPMLTSLLPGIDPNDFRKCLMTFNLIAHFANLAPFVNSSEASKYYNDLTEEEHTICEASASLEDFVLQFFDRIFAWVESNAVDFVRLEQTDNDHKSRLETISEGALLSVITSVLFQCSDEIFLSALKKLHNYATSNIFEPKISGKLVAILASAFAKVNPRETFKIFLPELCDTVQRLLGDDDEILKEEHLNDELFYNLQLLSEMLDGHSELIYYMDRLKKILDKVLLMTSLHGGRMASHMLNIIMTSLSFTRPLDYRSSNKPYSTPIKDFFTVREWAQPGDIKNLNIIWYEPAEMEIRCIQELINKYLVPEIEILEKYATGEVVFERKELRRRLRIVSALLGCHCILPAYQESPIQLVESVLDPWIFDIVIGTTPINLTMPGGKNIKKVVADTMHNVQKKILETDEGDTKSIHNIIFIYDILLFNKFRGRDFETHWKHFHVVKKVLEDRLHQNKSHLRYTLVDRVMLQQEFRNECRTCSFTATHKQILLDLFELCVSHYTEIRISAQSKLFTTVATFPYSYKILIPSILEIIQLDTTEHHEKFKGCLYVLVGTKSASIATRHDWSWIKDLWPLIVKSKPSEKPSIINLMNAIQNAVHYFPTITIKFEMPLSTITTAYELVKNIPLVSLEGFDDTIDNGIKLLEARNERRVLLYYETTNSLLDTCLNQSLHWRHQQMAVYFLKDLVHPDVKYNLQLVKFFLKSLIDDSIEIRKVSLRVFLFILLQNKPKYKKIIINPFSFCTDKKHMVTPGIRSDNEWLLYNSKTVPRNAIEWDQPRYLHRSEYGFYAWPKVLYSHAPYSEQPNIAKRLLNISEYEKEILDFCNAENIAKIIQYLSMEEKKGKDRFRGLVYLIFKNLFKLYEDHFLHLFIPHLERLVKDTQEQSHRCAAEIIAGIIKGAKHWSFKQVESLWSKLIPILRTAFTNLSIETMSDWGLCFTIGLDRRDPNRYHWLLEFLMDDPLGEQTSIISCGRICFIQSALIPHTWRNAELVVRLLEYLKPHLTHPFQNIREKISSCLTLVFGDDVGYPKSVVLHSPKVHDFFTFFMPQLNALYESTLGTVTKTEEKQNGSQMITNSKLDPDKEEHTRLFKTIAKYIISSLTRTNYSVVPDHYSLLPLICVLQSNDLDDELTTICANLLAVMAHTMVLEKYIPSALTAIRKVSTCPFWSARAVISEIIPVFVFHNFATIIAKDEWICEIQTIVLNLLEDIQPEVRHIAGRIVSGFLHCHFVPDPTALLAQFKLQSRTKLKGRNVSTTLVDSQFNNHSMRLRHAGVLGMCAFVSSHPYDVPDYLSDIFAELGKHLNDPQPIPSTIRLTLGDFKRTHHDNWDVHKLKFTEEELSLLSDLTVPPTYYA